MGDQREVFPNDVDRQPDWVDNETIYEEQGSQEDLDYVSKHQIDSCSFKGGVPEKCRQIQRK